MLKTFAVSLCLIALLAFTMVGCTTDRYLTKEQDDQMREVCESTGCAVLPADKWETIKKLLGNMLGV
jgi:hypothetical protein